MMNCMDKNACFITFQELTKYKKHSWNNDMKGKNWEMMLVGLVCYDKQGTVGAEKAFLTASPVYGI